MSDNREPYVHEVDTIALAEFVHEGLCGLGILDDADEILESYSENGGFDDVKKAQSHYNNAIAFVNETLDGHVNYPDLPLDFITDQDLTDWDFKEVKRCPTCDHEV